MSDSDNVQEARLVRLEVIAARTPPLEHGGAATEHGVQDKKRELHPGTTFANGGASFEIEVLAKRVGPSESVNFTGPFVHGKPGDRFLYLGWRPMDGPKDGWIRRWKIPLGGISWSMVEKLGSDDRLVAKISGEGAGTVPLLDGGWTQQQASV